MTSNSTDIDSCGVAGAMGAIVARLRAARDHEKCFVSAWPRCDQMSGWRGESGLECGCGCGPVR
jgi:hypothetical protein